MYVNNGLLFLLIWGKVQSFIFDPICASCLQIDQNLKTYDLFQKTNVTLFRLPGFSKSTIVIDLRHLSSIPTEKQGKQKNKQIVELIIVIRTLSQESNYTQTINKLRTQINIYELSATSQLEIFLYFQTNTQNSAYQYLYRQSVSLRLNYSNDRIPSEDSSYVFTVSSQDNINLPKNKPNIDSVRPYYLENQRNIPFQLSFQETYSQSTSYWKTQEKFVVPYFPYFTDCQNQGNLIQIMQILQHKKNCTLIPISQTKQINEFTFGSFAVADECSVKRKCFYGGEIQKKQYPQWQTLPIDSVLFSISQEKIFWRNFQFNMDIEGDNLVPCKINISQGSNSSSQYPLRVKLTMGYYQVTAQQKRIIQCNIDYSLYVTSKAQFEYQLEVVSYPLSHTYIMLSFGFNWYIYMIVFIMIGLISNVQHFILWIYHYWVAVNNKPIRIRIYLKVAKEIVKGTLLAVGLLLLCMVIVCILMNGKMFKVTFYDSSKEGATSPRVVWDYLVQKDTNNYDSTQSVNLRSGRMGLAFIVIGVFIILLTCHYFIGKQKHNDEYKDYDILGRVFKPLQWNRAKFLFGTFLYIILSLFFVYFAYSSLYSQNIWTFIVMMKLIQMVMEEITKSVFDDILPSLPLMIIIQIIAYLNTLSADDFYDFLFSFLVDVAMTMIEKTYVFQLQDIVVDKIKQKSEQWNKFYFNLMNESEQQIQLHADIQENHQNTDNQRVFIHRQTQQVQFFQQEIKQTYSREQDQDLVNNSIQTQQQKKIKKKYFQALTKQYQKQKQLLLKGNQQKNAMLEQQKIKNYNNGVAEEDIEQIKQKQSMIFQLLVDLIAMIYTFLLQPFIVFILWLTYSQSAILSEYGISFNTVVLYNLSAIVIGLFSVINVVVIFHILESYMDLSFLQQITKLLDRFFNRKAFWKADDSDLNVNIKDILRGADHYCLSSQFFFILTIYLCGMILVLVGLAIFFNTNYYIFDDVASIPIILFWVIVLQLACWICEKVAKILNIWDYQTFQTQNKNENQEKKKIFGICDQVNFQDSQYKTENILFVDDFTQDFLIQNKTKKSTLYNKSSKKVGSRLQIDLIPKHRKKNLKQLKMNLKIQNFKQKDQIILAHKRLETICKKLEPLFTKDSFKMQYCLRNKEYIKNNIQKILPLVDFLPELQQFKNIHLAEAKAKQEQNAKKQQTKNMQPGIAQLILSWFRTTEKERDRRISNGLQYESKKKKCSFCYSTWGLYYGFGGICLQCSLRMIRQKKQRKDQNQTPQNSKDNFIQKDYLNIIQEQQQEKSVISRTNHNHPKLHRD